MTSPTPVLLQVEKLSVAFRRQSGDWAAAATDVSFQLERGETLALVGASGSGKTVSAMAIPALLPPAAQCRIAGSIRLMGEELVGLPEAAIARHRGNHIGVVFQEPMTALNPLHTLGRQLAEGLRIHHTHTPERIPARVAELLEMVGLGYLRTRLNAYPHQLSGGERQRLTIAIAMACQPDLLIADEPTTALDVTLQAKILDLLLALQREHGMGLLLISHDLPLVRHHATRVAVMQAGRVVEHGATAQVMEHPQHAYTRELLAAQLSEAPLPAITNAPTVLEMQAVGIAYGETQAGVLGWLKKPVLKPAVRDVNITLSAGETLGIVGESGSGKTTLAMGLLRLLPPKAVMEGAVLLSGENIATLSRAALRQARAGIQLVFQDPFGSLNPRLTVGEIIAEGLLAHQPSLTETERTARVAEALAEVDLPPETADRYPHAFSGGQRQRIAIARALILKPKLMVLDEPTSALDVLVQRQVLALLQRVQTTHGIAFILITHDMRVIRAMAHQLLVLHKGDVVEQGTATQVLTTPQNAYTQTLLKAAAAL